MHKTVALPFLLYCVTTLHEKRRAMGQKMAIKWNNLVPEKILTTGIDNFKNFVNSFAVISKVSFVCGNSTTLFLITQFHDLYGDILQRAF